MEPNSTEILQKPKNKSKRLSIEQNYEKSIHFDLNPAQINNH